MIFVTVGTTHFDKLIQQVDDLARDGFFNDKVVCQIGSGNYEPIWCEWYRFKPSIDSDFSDANLIITHGGFTVLESIWNKKRLVAVANTDLTGNHQARFLKALSKEVPLHWTQDVNQLKDRIMRSVNSDPAVWAPPYLAMDLNDFLDSVHTKSLT